MTYCERGLATFLLFTALSQAQPAANAGLPVKRVVLYKNGVGYFELQGRVQGSQDVGIPFTSGQLNDVLKSLTVLDLGGGRITGVGYASAAPLDRQLGDLRLPIAERTNLNDFLGALRGAHVEIRSGSTTISGRVLGVERKTRSMNGIWNDIDIATVISDSGEVHTAELVPGSGIKLLDAGLPGRIDRYLDIVSSNREADVRRMTVSTEGTGTRDLFVSYVSEVPVWKSTYRIVLGGKEPLLQGWAIVDNTVGQDWDNVQLSLVAGAPQSFIQNLSQPYFTRRPMVGLPNSVSITPQTYQATLVDGSPQQIAVNALTGRVETSSASMARVGGRGAGSGGSLGSGAQMGQTQARAFAVPEVAGGVAGGTPGGVVGGIIGSVPSAAPPPAPPPPPEVTAQELGDLFEYKLKSPITVRKNQSAMVPIAQTPISAEKISIWNDRSGLPRPTRALWLTNTSGLTLDGGSFSVLEDETFAGEGVFDPIRPGEKRIVSYAIDLAINASSKNSVDAQQVTRVRASEGVLIQESELRERKTYTFRNEDATTRTVLVEHPVRNGYTLRGATQPIETSADWMRFRVPVPSKQSVQFSVDEGRPIEMRYQLESITPTQLDLFVRQKSINKAIEDALHKILAQKDTVVQINSRKDAREEEMKRIFDDQQRLRENMRSLKGSTEEKQLLQRYTAQLNEQETRLERLQKEIEAIGLESAAAEEKLGKLIRELTFDVKL